MNEGKAFRPSLAGGERAPFDRLIARCLAREVDADLWAALGAPETSEALERLAPGFRAALGVPLDDALQETLDEEYARLFLLPGLVPPIASRWLPGDQRVVDGSEGGPHGKTTGAARDAITTLLDRASEAFGLTLDPIEARGALPPDHAARLFAVSAEIGSASGISDDERAEWAALFTEELLGEGWQRFGAALEEAADHPAYRMLGALIRTLHPAPLEQTASSSAV